jgi:hypothetical protein
VHTFDDGTLSIYIGRVHPESGVHTDFWFDEFSRSNQRPPDCTIREDSSARLFLAGTTADAPEINARSSRLRLMRCAHGTNVSLPLSVPVQP